MPPTRSPTHWAKSPLVRSTPSTFSHATVAISSLFVTGALYWMPLAFYLLWRKYKSWKARVLLVLSIALAAFVPLKHRRSLRSGWFWDCWLDYFGWPGSKSVKVITESTLADDTPYLFCFLPHGVFPYHMALTSIHSLWDTYFKRSRIAVADVALRVPVIRNLIRQVADGISVSKESISKELIKGHSVSLSPGGIGEVRGAKKTAGRCCFEFLATRQIFCAANPGEEILLHSRKGFVRLAMEHGVPLVPVYVFGSSKAFVVTRWMSSFESLSRLFKAAFIIFYGHWGLPIPRNVALMYVIGKPIAVAKCTTPSDLQVDEVHKKFVSAVQELFLTYRTVYGWDKVDLRVT